MRQEAIFSDIDKSWDLPEPQFRLRRLQVYNWGTFSGLHDIPISEKGFLFVGRSGSGKSTLLDALSALLVPPASLGFNAAAREGDKGRYDRNMPSYIRGAWADQEDSGTGLIATQFLRPNSTWSALAVEYRNPEGRVVSLVQIYWLKGTNNKPADVKRHFMIADRPFNVISEMKDFDFDLRRLKNRLKDICHHEKFRAYSERFRRLLGIESEMALKLLHKTQSAKNLGDLNDFLREFMLDKPKTFDVAKRMVEEFAELDAAHQEVVKARKQVDTLTPAKEEYEKHLCVKEQIVSVELFIDGVEAYRILAMVDLLEQELQTLEIRKLGLDGQLDQQQEARDNHRARLVELENQHRDQGGGEIERLEQKKQEAEQQREQRLEKHRQVEKSIGRMQWDMPSTPQGFAEIISRAKKVVENWRAERDQADSARDNLRDVKKETEEEFTRMRCEIEAMQRQPSNIPAYMLELRQKISDELGLSENDLPFVGELVEVKEEESGWRGSIERVLRGFALSILVDESHYASVSHYVNKTHLKKRLVYYKVINNNTQRQRAVSANSLVKKLNVKESSYRDWLINEMENRFDYSCVENMRDFQQHDRAITREGQIRHGKSRHEKDDRFTINDLRNWVLGFDNRNKLLLYQDGAQQLAEKINQTNKLLRELEQQRDVLSDTYEASASLVNLQWREIDVAGVLDEIQHLDKQLRYLRQGNQKLVELGEQIKQEKKKIIDIEEVLSGTKAKYINVKDNISECNQKLQEVNQIVLDSILIPRIKDELAVRFNQIEQTITLKNIDRVRSRVEKQLNSEKEGLKDELNELKSSLEKRFTYFIREWPAESADFDSTLASAQEFIQLLTRLESDGLPKYEERFFTMLKEQSNQNLAELNQRISQARNEIMERMDTVNLSLSEAEFNPGTHLEIDVKDRYLPDVKDFREQVKLILQDAWAMNSSEAESRFTHLRELVNKLGNQEPEYQRWRNQVLDVRQHVEFLGREYDKQGTQHEIYRSGAGKSGGQREKLATTCLAAALRYQLGGSDNEEPVYAPVVLDEAFGKADNEFTELAMNIFKKFGFQMIVATPLKSVMTLEPFIGGACFVDIKDRKHSQTLQIEYDHEQQRLNLPD